MPGSASFDETERPTWLLFEASERADAGGALTGALPQQSAPTDPFLDLTARRAAISRVSDTWPLPGAQKSELLLEHICHVWVLHGIERKCVAGLYRTTFGIELRLHLGND